MKKIEKEQIIKVTVYVADDGQEFDNEQNCIHHERYVNGEIKECPNCHGEGRVFELVKGENYHTGAQEEYLEYHICPICKGKGYLEKKTTWE